MVMEVVQLNQRNIINQIIAKKMAQVWPVRPLTFDLKNSQKSAWGFPSGPNGSPCMIISALYNYEGR